MDNVDGVESRGFARGMMWTLVAYVAPPVFSFVVMMVAARMLLHTAMNDYQVAIGYATMFTLMGDLGFSGILVRRVAKDHNRLEDYYGTFLVMRLAIVIALYLVSVALAFYLYKGNNNVIALIAFAGLGQVIFQAGTCFISFYQGLERFEYIGLGTVARSALYFVMGWILVGFFQEWGLVLATVMSNVTALVIYYYYFKSEVIFGRPFKIRFNYQLCKELVVESLPFSVNVLSGTLMVFADRFILSITKYSQVAYYSLPATLVMSLTFISIAYATVAYPFITRLLHTNSMVYVYEKSFKYLVAIMAPMCVGLFVLADRVIYLVYGSGYADSIDVLRVLSVMLFFFSVSIITSAILQAQHREGEVFRAQLIVFVANVALNLVLCPIFGAMGCAVACLVTLGLLGAGINMYLMRADIMDIGMPGTLFRVGASCLVMALGIVLIPVGNVFAYTLLGIVLYSACFLVLGGVTKDDISLAKTILHKDA